LDFGSRGVAGPLDAGAFDIASDYLTHFTGIKRLADVIVRTQSQSFFSRIKSAETGQHDDREVWVNFTDLAQSFDPSHARHPDVHYDGVGLFFLYQLEARFNVIGSVHVVVRLEQHS